MSVWASVNDAYLLARRETTQLFRRKARLIGLFVQPLLFLLVFGFLFDIALRPNADGWEYLAFLVPGLVGQRMITTASRGGMGLIRDRGGGFLKEVLVAPVSRTSVLMGLAFGQTIRAVIQGLFLILVGIAITDDLRFGGSWTSPLLILAALGIALMMGLAIVMLSMAVAWKMDDAQEFSLVATYLTWPLFFLSGAMYPLSRVPQWLKIPILFNPLSYAVDGMRQLGLGPRAAHFPLWLDILVVFAVFLLALSFALKVMGTQQAD